MKTIASFLGVGGENDVCACSNVLGIDEQHTDGGQIRRNLQDNRTIGRSYPINVGWFINPLNNKENLTSNGLTDRQRD